MKILLTGGSGILGSELLKINSSIFAPSSKDLDITVSKNNNYDFDILIHCAALTNTIEAENNPKKANLVNIFGTINMLNLAIENDAKFVYMSTDYVFDGEKGYYSTIDKINPISNYAKTKAAGELLARTYEKSTILRTSFCQSEFPYDKAFCDQWTSRDYVDIIAPLVYNAAINYNSGLYHIGTERKSVYELALRRKFVIPIKRSDVSSVRIPKDTSFLI